MSDDDVAGASNNRNNGPRKFYIHPPKSFMEFKGETTTDFRTWYTRFERFLLLQDMQNQKKLTEHEKILLFLNNLGDEGESRVQSHPVVKSELVAQNPSLRSVKEAASEVFGDRINEIASCHEFFTCMQTPGESLEEYITSLRDKVADCGFDAQTSNRLLAIVFSYGLADKKITKKLLAEKEIRLEKFLEIARAETRAESDANAISDSTKTQVHKMKDKFVKRPPYQKSGGTSGTKNAAKKSCARCGFEDHNSGSNNSGSKSCPALSSSCNYCGIKGHWEASKSGKTLCFKKRKEESKTPVKVIKVCKTVSIEPPITTDLVVQSRSGGSPSTITGEIDTGSPVTLIPTKMFRKEFPGIKLDQGNANLANGDNSEMKGQRGSFPAQVWTDSTWVYTTIYVVDSVDAPLFGRDICVPLDIFRLKVHSIDFGKSGAHDILKRYPKLHSEQLGTYPKRKHVIQLREDAVPSVAKLRGVPFAQRDKVASEIQNMEKQGIWEPASNTDWVHGMVVVPKPNGSLRITSDLSPLNRHVVPKRHPLPNIKDMMVDLKDATIFSKLDLKKAYYHIVLSDESRPLTATITQEGVKQYCRLPMGLTDAAAVFQEAISETMQGVSNVACYQDDIIVYGKTVLEHDMALEEVCKRLSDNDFRICSEKCELAKSQVKFLGHLITAGNISPDPDKIAAIQNLQPPKTTREVQSFLGFIQFLADYVPMYAEIAEPLHALTRKDAKFVWSAACETAFRTIITTLSGNIANAIFDPNLPSIVTTDASQSAVGAVLSQIVGGKEVPICFASHTLSATERNYATNEREALAAMWACEKFEKFLIGTKFTLRTDHTGLKCLLGKHVTARQSSKFARWRERLAAFDFSIEYKPGRKNILADALSRLPTNAENHAIDNASLQIHSVSVLGTTAGVNYSAIQQAVSSDKDVVQIKTYLQGQWPDKSRILPSLRAFYNVRDDLSVQNDGTLLLEDRLYVPESLRQRVLESAHSGHPGIVRMKRLLRECYWWPGMNKAVESLVKGCQACQCSDKSAPQNLQPTQSVKSPDRPMAQLSIDITGPFAIAKPHERFVVALIDNYTKYPWVLLTGDVSAPRIIRWLDTIFASFGLPEVVLSDNGPQFSCTLFAEYLKSKDIRQHRTPNYDPRPNGLVEVFNRVLKFGVQAFGSVKTPFATGIQELVASFRGTPQFDGDKSPAGKMFSYDYRLPFQANRRQNKDSENRQQADVPQGTKGDEGSSEAKFRGPFKAMQWVKVKLPHVGKGYSPWSAPLQIEELVGNYVYRLSDGKIWSARRLRPYYSPRYDDQGFTMLDTDPDPTERAATGAKQPKQQPVRRSQRLNKGKKPIRYDANQKK